MPVAKCYNLNRNRITVPRVKLAFLDSHHNPFLYGSVALDKLLIVLESAAAKSLQSCPTLCNPIDGSPPGSPPWDSPGKNTGVGCHLFLQSTYL